jgi:hypothetical protein
LNYLTPEDEMIGWLVVLVVVGIPFLKAIFGVLGILGVFNDYDRITRRK